MLARGITLEVDCFGIEMTTEAYGGWDFPSDRERIDGVAALVARGWADQVLISTDVCMKFQLRAYGGRRVRAHPRHHRSPDAQGRLC